jgi:AcrR family transcriptional regulator
MRKKPQQARSKELVNAILEASLKLIAKEGFDAFTTPRVAEMTGISVGSLYQYFSNKEEIFLALLDQQLNSLNQQWDALLPLMTEMKLDDVVMSVIRLTLVFMENEEGFYLEVWRNWNRLPIQDIANRIEHYMLDNARLYFIQHYQEYPVQDLSIRLFVAYNSTVFTLMRALSVSSPKIDTEVLVKSLAEMIVPYLSGKSVLPAQHEK